VGSDIQEECHAYDLFAFFFSECCEWIMAFCLVLKVMVRYIVNRYYVIDRKNGQSQSKIVRALELRMVHVTRWQDARKVRMRQHEISSKSLTSSNNLASGKTHPQLSNSHTCA